MPSIWNKIQRRVRKETEKLQNNNKGQITGVVGVVIALTVMLIIGLYVFSSIETSIDITDLSIPAQTAINNTTDLTYIAFYLLYSGFDLLSTPALIIAIVVIIIVIIGRID